MAKLYLTVDAGSYDADMSTKKKTATPKPETLTEDFYNRSQSWCFVWTVKLGEHRCRVIITRNAYDEQSHVRGYKWDGKDGWMQVDHQPMSQDMACFKTSYVMENPSREPFRKDAEKMLARVTAIIL